MDSAVSAILEGIHAGIPQYELEAKVAAAVAGGDLTPAAGAAARDLWLRVAERSRREEVLRALHDTATDLTGIRDVEAVLQAIVGRTRTLSGSDMAYLSLNDHASDETYIRKSDGVVTEAYRMLRMPIGTGVVGRAAAGVTSYQSADYLGDPEIIHLPQVDAIVRAEGVRSILGVPMYLHGKAIGALLVADRTPRDYPAETVDLLDTIGKHAAVALDNAERFSAIRGALERLGQEQASRQHEMSELQSLMALDRRLIETVIGGGGYEAFADLARHIVASRVAVLDAADGVLAARGGEHWAARVSELATGALAGPLRMAAATGEPRECHSGGDTFLLVPARTAGGHLATLVLADRLPDLPAGLVERLSIFLTILRLFDRAAHDAAQQLQIEVLDDLLSGREVSTDRKRQRASRFGLRPTDDLTVVVLAAPGADQRRMAARLRSAVQTPRALIARYNDDFCVVATDDGSVAERIRAALADEPSPPTLGFAGPATGFDRLSASYRQARRALATLLMLGRTGASLDGARLGAVGLLLDAAHTLDPAFSPLTEIQPLLDYDAQHRTALTETAWAHLEFGANIARTAEELFIHRNTVRQRLTRIGGLLGEDWLDGPRRLEIHLAVRVWKLAGSGLD
ncbi:helix-turn-helix domain-containing protein [Nocardia goodfellowii]|uniref:GAF domain-containing protein n=1 Tax=Nocardia goodfellowii TaxID=882446 RepID=A0ABS4QR89_9NOCA|nr:helix-turn-helix domain-containing protein [Nocardia goodfellowii]MBP2194226.1 GAF domain-containing protein [Nocardia goodfellowii]